VDVRDLGVILALWMLLGAVMVVVCVLAELEAPEDPYDDDDPTQYMGR
jgi:hypothetical protein